MAECDLRMAIWHSFLRSCQPAQISTVGDFAGRSRFLLDTLAAVREIWPENLPLTARFGVIEYDGRDEETFGGINELIKLFRNNGLDMVNVSVGFQRRMPLSHGICIPGAGCTACSSGSQSAGSIIMGD